MDDVTKYLKPPRSYLVNKTIPGNYLIICTLKWVEEDVGGIEEVFTPADPSKRFIIKTIEFPENVAGAAVIAVDVDTKEVHRGHIRMTDFAAIKAINN